MTFKKDIKSDAEWFERISKFHNETLTDFTISDQAIERDFKCVAMGTCGKQIYINELIISYQTQLYKFKILTLSDN